MTKIVFIFINYLLGPFPKGSHIIVILITFSSLLHDLASRSEIPSTNTDQLYRTEKIHCDICLAFSLPR